MRRKWGEEKVEKGRKLNEDEKSRIKGEEDGVWACNVMWSSMRLSSTDAMWNSHYNDRTGEEEEKEEEEEVEGKIE